MADAKKCDRCGKYYEYNDDKDDEFMLKKYEPDWNGDLIERIELCQDCMESFIVWFNECKITDTRVEYYNINDDECTRKYPGTNKDAAII